MWQELEEVDFENFKTITRWHHIAYCTGFNRCILVTGRITILGQVLIWYQVSTTPMSIWIQFQATIRLSKCCNIKEAREFQERKGFCFELILLHSWIKLSLDLGIHLTSQRWKLHGHLVTGRGCSISLRFLTTTTTLAARCNILTFSSRGIQTSPYPCKKPAEREYCGTWISSGDV